MQLIDQGLTFIAPFLGPMLEFVEDQQRWILPSLVSALAAVGIVRLLADCGQVGARIRTDVILRCLWKVMLCGFAWLPVVMGGALLEPQWNWLSDRLNDADCYSWLPAIAAMLLLRASFDVENSGSSANQKMAPMRGMIGVVCGVVLSSVILFETSKASGYITLSMVDVDIVHLGHNHGVHKVAENILQTSVVGLAILFFNLVALWRYIATRGRASQWLTVFSLMGLVVIAVYLDAVVAVPLTCTLPPSHFSRDPRRWIASVVFLLPLTSAAGFRLAKVGASEIRVSPGEQDAVISIVELTIFGFLIANFVVQVWNRFRYADFWPVTTPYIAMAALFSSAFACGRWLDMRWSRHIRVPATYALKLSAPRVLVLTSVATIQAVAFCVCLAWFVLVILYLPLP